MYIYRASLSTLGNYLGLDRGQEGGQQGLYPVYLSLNSTHLLTHLDLNITGCPRSTDPFYVVTHYI